MRRKDRCVTDKKEILEIMKRCDVCSLAFYDEDFPYIVPMNFGVREKEDNFELYFHCAKQGKKLELLRANAHVAFEMNGSHKLYLEENACDSTMEFESVCGNGIMEELSPEEKKTALNILMQQYSGKSDYNYDDRILNEVTVLKLSVNEICGKRLIKR